MLFYRSTQAAGYVGILRWQFQLFANTMLVTLEYYADSFPLRRHLIGGSAPTRVPVARQCDIRKSETNSKTTSTDAVGP